MSTMDSDFDLKTSFEVSDRQKPIKTNERSTTEIVRHAQNSISVLCDNNSPLEDGEIEDEDSEECIIDKSISENKKIFESSQVSANFAPSSKCRDSIRLKRAQQTELEFPNKGRRLNNDSELPNRFQKASGRASKFPSRSSRGQSSKSFGANRTETTNGDRQWNTAVAGSVKTDQTNTESNDDSNHSKQRGQQRTNFRNNRHNRKQVPVCRFFIESRCNKGSECTFSHDAQPIKRFELCKFYLNGFCVKHEHCNFMHDDFPCKFFHGPHGTCNSSGSCRFSHDPINDPRIQAAFEKSLSDSNDDTTETENVQHTTSYCKPSLLGSPPKDTQATCSNHSPTVRHSASVSKAPCNYYKESVLTLNTAVSLSDSIETTASEFISEDRRRPMPILHHQPQCPYPPPHVPIPDSNRYCSDFPQPAIFQNQWSMHGCSIPHQLSARHCSESMCPPPPSPIFSFVHRLQQNAPKFPVQPRMRIPSNQHFPSNEQILPGNWMTAHPIRYRYSWTHHINQQVPMIRPPIDLHIENESVTSNDKEKYQTLQDLINAIGLDPSTPPTHRFTQQSDANNTEESKQSVCARLEELIRSIQTSNEVTDTSTDSELSQEPIAYIQAQTNSFKYRIHKIDMSPVIRNIPSPSELPEDCRDPRITRTELPIIKDTQIDDRRLNGEPARKPACINLSRPTDPRLKDIYLQHSGIR